MQHKFLVGVAERPFEDGAFRIITATDAEEATIRFLAVFAPEDDTFLSTVYDRSINMSFAENFWFLTEEEQSRSSNGGSAQVTEEEFKKRVRDFFGQHSEYADLYIKSYFADNSQPDIKAEFPDEMLAFMWLHSDHGAVKVYRLDEIESVAS